jgi:tetratricopeptide (TPR) repeat protein
MATVLQRRGGLYEYLGMFDGAMTSFEQAERIQKDIGDRYFRSACLADIGWELTRRGKFTGAEKAYQEAIDIRAATGSPNPRLLCRQALIFVEKPQYESTNGDTKNGQIKISDERLKDLQRAEKLIKEAGATINKENIEDQLLLGYVQAKIVLEQGQRSAANQFRKLKDQARTAGAQKFVFLASTGEGMACERLKRPDEAKLAYTEAESYITGIEKELPADDRTSFRQGEQILGIKNDLASEGLRRINSG